MSTNWFAKLNASFLVSSMTVVSSFVVEMVTAMGRFLSLRRFKLMWAVVQRANGKHKRLLILMGGHLFHCYQGVVMCG